MRSYESMNSIKKWLSLFLLGALSLSAEAQTSADSLFLSHEHRAEELDFVIRQIDSVYVYGRRGISPEEWERRVEVVRQKLYNAKNRNEYYYALRYMGMLIEDGHFTFPDRGYYNRTRIFQKTDTLFPVRVKTWKDGTTYVLRDYTGRMPENAKIIRVNGHLAQEMSVIQSSTACWEKERQDYYGSEAPDPAHWYNLMNFLFMEGVRAPYQIEYMLPGSERVDTATLGGMTREEIHKASKKYGTKAKGDNVWNLLFGGKTITTKKIGKHSAVMTIDYFWGEDMFALLLFNKDKRYPRKLKKVMAWVHRQRIDTLVLDISMNSGGMTDNVYKTLNYFTEKSVDANCAYRVNDGNRAKVKTVIRNTQYEQLFGLTPEQHQRIADYVDSIPTGSYFTTNMVYDLRFRPDPDLKHRYRGQVYLLTSSATYSAAQLFAQHFKELGIGITAGQPCGGYASVSGGNAQRVELPYAKRFSIAIPYASLRNDVHAPRFEFDPVDIPVDQDKITCDEWLAGQKEEDISTKFIRLFRSGKLPVHNPTTVQRNYEPGITSKKEGMFDADR